MMGKQFTRNAIFGATASRQIEKKIELKFAFKTIQHQNIQSKLWS